MALTQITGSGIAIGAKPNVAFKIIATNTDQSYTASDYAKITWETTALDTGSYWDSTNNRYTPQVAGWYLFGGQLRLQTLSGEVTLISFLLTKNGATSGSERLMAQFQTGSDTFTNGEYPFPTGMIQLNGSSDYVEAFFQSEENCNIHDNTRPSFFWGMLVHPT
tara:strand:- start:62 stop:553 length:492 start_codon:yes stop_codon:yes gene_type:complete